LVDRILFDASGTASGVRLADGTEHLVAAGGEVILSAGTIHSPAILLRSGIGPEGDLRRLGIAVHANLPAGLSLQEHAVIPVPFAAAPGAAAGAGSRHCNVCLRYTSGLADAGPNDMFMIGSNSVFSDVASLGVWINRACSTGSVRIASPDPTVD